MMPLGLSLVGSFIVLVAVRRLLSIYERRVSMATENRTFVATENCTLLGRTSRAERTFSR